MRIITLLSIFVLFVINLHGQSVSALIEQARLEQEPEKKIALLTKATRQAPRSAAAWHHRADAYRQWGKLPDALQDYTRAINLAPRDPFRYYARALAYIDEGKYPQAEADLTKAISFKKEYADFYLQRATCLMESGKYAAAIADYQIYVSKRKKTVPVAIHLAQAYLQTYQYAQAEKELDFVQKIQPQSAEVYFWRGRILQAKNHLDEAVSFYSKALNRDSAYAPAYRYRASAFKDMGELEASAEDYTRLIELTPDALFYNRRGLVYEEMQEWKKAIADYTSALELSPNWSIAYNNRGYVYLKQKKYALARADFEKALQADDTLPTPYVNLAGLSWLQKKDRRNVYAYLEEALKRHFRDFESLYDEDKKGWMFTGINGTAEFRTVIYK